MDYQEAKKLGYKYITRDRIGGECAHKRMPKLRNGFWISEGWRYVEGYVYKNKSKPLAIDEAIRLEGFMPPPKEPKTGPKEIEAICEYCGKPFMSHSKSRKYCSDKCYNDNRR